MKTASISLVPAYAFIAGVLAIALFCVYGVSLR